MAEKLRIYSMENILNFSGRPSWFYQIFDVQIELKDAADCTVYYKGFIFSVVFRYKFRFDVVRIIIWTNLGILFLHVRTYVRFGPKPLVGLAVRAQDNCIVCVLFQLSNELSLAVVYPGAVGLSWNCYWNLSIPILKLSRVGRLSTSYISWQDVP